MHFLINFFTNILLFQKFHYKTVNISMKTCASESVVSKIVKIRYCMLLYLRNWLSLKQSTCKTTRFPMQTKLKLIF